MRCARLLLRPSVAGYMPHDPVETNPVVFFDLHTPQRTLGRVSIELFADVVPAAAENFRSLCTGERGEGRWHPVPGAKLPLTYKGVPFHRIIPNFCVQGGDIVHKDGRGNASVFGYLFRDESLVGKAGDHLAGTVALASSGPNENGSQFFFNLDRSKHLDGKFVVVGQVVDGWDVVLNVSNYGSRNGTPIESVWISDCGQTSGVEVPLLAALPNKHEALQDVPGREVLAMLSARDAPKEEMPAWIRPQASGL